MGVLMVCEAAPPWLQEAKTYRVPVAPGLVLAANVWGVPGAPQLVNVAGVVTGAPSTTIVRPTGLLVMTKVEGAVINSVLEPVLVANVSVPEKTADTV